MEQSQSGASACDGLEYARSAAGPEFSRGGRLFSIRGKVNLQPENRVGKGQASIQSKPKQHHPVFRFRGLGSRFFFKVDCKNRSKIYRCKRRSEHLSGGGQSTRALPIDPIFPFGKSFTFHEFASASLLGNLRSFYSKPGNGLEDLARQKSNTRTENLRRERIQSSNP